MIVNAVSYNDFAIFIALSDLRGVIQGRIPKTSSMDEQHQLSTFAGHVGEFLGMFEQETRYQLAEFPENNVVMRQEDIKKFAVQFLPFLTRAPKGTAKDFLVSLCEAGCGEETAQQALLFP